MKRNRMRIALLTLLSACMLCHGNDVAAQREDDVRQALRTLKGLEEDRTKEWAVEVLREEAESNLSGEAMNALGIACLTGTGTEYDKEQGLQWLERAGSNGYNAAFHNLGVIYKLGRYGVAQDFKRAFAVFSEGAELGQPSCLYDAGYMLYKGLGCTQDYKKAAMLFFNGTRAGNTAAMYMLGLCFRNGYGVERDEALADSLLQRSAVLDYKPALEELLRPEPENCLGEDFSAENSLPRQMPEVNATVNEVSMFSGQYSGFIVMYDWSGQHVLGEKPVTMSVEDIQGDSLTGKLIFANDTVPFRAGITSEGRLSFTAGKVSLDERYTVGKKVSYTLNEAMLDIWKDNIKGRLSLYSLKEKEPERPMYMELQKRPSPALPVREGDDADEDADRYTRIVAAPNPFSTDFSATFELAEACEAQVRIFNQFGVLVYGRALGMLEAGTHTETFSPNILDGTYVLNIKAGQQVLRTIIVKKGGAR